MGEPLIAASLSGIAVLLIFVGILRLVRADAAISARLGQYAVAGPVGVTRPSTKQSPFRRGMNRLVGNQGFAESTARDLARANLKLTVSEYVMVHVIAVVFGFILAYLITRNPAFSLIGALVGFYAPGFYVRRRHHKRLAAFNGQLGDTINLLSNSMRSGYSMLQSMEMVAREAPEPTRQEFNRVVREVSLGLSPEEALANLVRRLASDDLDLLVTAINVQREVGGNLAQILDTIGTTIRERVRIKGEIKVLSAQQTMSGYVISALPVVLGLLLFLVNPSYMMPLFSTEKLICVPAIALPICGAVMMVVGFIAIRKIVDIDV